jgi:hypothetical protein
MQCGAKTRSGSKCQKFGMANGRCRLHGGMSRKGRDHWNYQHGECTKEARRKNVKFSSYLKLLEQLAIKLEMIQ